MGIIRKTKKDFSFLEKYFKQFGYDGFQESVEKPVDLVVKTMLEHKLMNIDDEITLLDIGSLNGVEAVMFSEKLNNVKIHSFEPDPRCFHIVDEVVKDYENIKPHRLALSNFSGTSIFHRSHTDGLGSLLKPIGGYTDGDTEETFDVDVSTLSEWAKTNDIKNIDIIWMDVQGSELNVLKGISDELFDNIKLIYLEAAVEQSYENQAFAFEIVPFLEKYGFRFLQAEPVTHSVLVKNNKTGLIERMSVVLEANILLIKDNK